VVEGLKVPQRQILTLLTTPSDFVRTALLEKRRAVKFWNLKPFSSKEKVGPPMRLG
jgi:hypothetical protein